MEAPEPKGKRYRIRVWMLLLFVGAPLIGCFSVVLLARRQPKVTRAGIVRIEEGLGQITEKDIEGVFGSPGAPVQPTDGTSTPEGTYYRLWRGHRRFSLILFNNEGVAVGQWQGLTREPEPLDRFRDYFGM